MSSERNIPYEDEVSPGPSRQATINNNNNTKMVVMVVVAVVKAGTEKMAVQVQVQETRQPRNKNNVRQLMTRLRRTLLEKSDGPSES